MNSALPPRYSLIVATLAGVLFVGSAQFLVVAPILPRIAEDLLVPEERLGSLVTAYTISVGCFALIAGPVSDHFGRRTILRIGTTAMTITLLCHAFATSFETLMLARFFTGISSGFLGGAAMAYIGDVIPDSHRGRAMGIVSAGFAAGQVLGIPVGTLLAGWDYRAPFVLFGVLMVFFTTACWTALAPSPRKEGPFRLIEALSGYRALAKRRSIWLVCLASTTMMVSVSTFIVYEPLWIERHFGVGQRSIALLFFVGGMANMVAGIYAGRLADRFSRKSLTIWASVAMGVGMVATPFMPSYEAILVWFMITMALVGMRISPMNAWISNMVPTKQRGSLMALTLATGQVGFGLGSAASGYIFSNFGFFGSGVSGLIGALATGLLLSFVASEPELSS